MVTTQINSEKKANPLLTKLAQDVKSTVRNDDHKQAHASMKFALLLGAGASFSSGVPLVWQMIQHFKGEVYERYGVKFINEKEEKAWLSTQHWYQKKESEYAKFFEECYDTETKRRSYIESIIANAEPSFGYMVLANLIHYGYFRTVITTNFDDLIYIASTTFTPTRPVVYSLGGFATEMTLTSERPRILKLHGDFLYSSLKNTGEEIKHQDTNMKKEVQKVLEEYDGIIVAGYGGGDKSVVDMLKRIPKGKTLYWCYRKGNLPGQSIQNFVKGNGKHLVEIDGFDELMNFIREYIGISNNALANNHKSNLDKMTNLLFKFEDKSTINFIEEIAKGYQILSYKVSIDNAISNNNHKDIERYCRKVLELDQNDDVVYYNLGACAEKIQSRQQEAENLYLKAISLNPNEAGYHVALGNLVARNENRQKDAEYIFGITIKTFPFYAEAFLSFGAFLSKDEKRQSDAEKLTRRAIELNPDDANAYYNLGLILVKDKNRIEEAEKLFRQTIKLKPAFGDAYDNLGLIILNERGDLVEAEKLHRKAIELNPKSANAYNNLGTVLFHDKNRISEAESIYQKAINLNPKFVAAYYNLGILLSESTDNFDKAKQMYQKTIEIEPNHAAAHNNLAALILQEKSDNKLAEQLLKTAIKIKPEFPASYLNLGILYSENSDKQKEAEKLYRKAIKLNSNYAEAYLCLGNLLSKNSSRQKEREKIYRKALALNPTLVDVYNMLINLLKRQKRFNDASEIIDIAIENKIQCDVIFLHIAALAKQKGNITEFKEYAEKAKQAIAKDDWYNLACLESLNENKNKTLDYLKKAVKKNPAQKESAKEDPDLEWIRDDPKFKKIVEE
ncbi:MAG: tetratricopeptide repeat protein [Acidobacteriota bacterium]|nr:tetratricopeptide repeat protein [Acidobacteriota bacterium]